MSSWKSRSCCPKGKQIHEGRKKLKLHHRAYSSLLAVLFKVLNVNLINVIYCKIFSTSIKYLFFVMVMFWERPPGLGFITGSERLKSCWFQLNWQKHTTYNSLIDKYIFKPFPYSGVKEFKSIGNLLLTYPDARTPGFFHQEEKNHWEQTSV